MFRFSIFLLALCAFITGIVYFRAWDNLPPQIPLYFAQPWGDEQLGSPRELLGVSVFMALLYLGNILVAYWLRKNNYLSMVLLISTCFFVVVTAYGLIRIVLLVT